MKKVMIALCVAAFAMSASAFVLGPGDGSDEPGFAC